MKEQLKKLCIKLGENNKPIYAVMAIAVAKGIARPTITMMDKHEDPQTKKYTAMRELLTEIVAIPTYWACGELTGNLANKLNLPADKKALARLNFMFLGVCAAALVVIPALASLTIKPFMNSIQKSSKKDVYDNKTKPVVKKTAFKSDNYNKLYKNYIPMTKVGGLW